MVIQVPAQVADQLGSLLEVRRAWPGKGGRLLFEAVELISGRLRAGSIDEAGLPRVTPYGEDPVLQGLSAAVAAGGDLLVHRYQRRAVVRSHETYRKFVAPGRTPLVEASHTAAAGVLGQAGFTVPDVVASDETSVTFSAIHGLSVHELAQNGDRLAHGESSAGEAVHQDEWNRAWGLWSQCWPKFALSPEAHGANLPAILRHTPTDEAKIVNTWVDRTVSAGALGVSSQRLIRAGSRVVSMLAADPDPLVMAHRDLHDKQLLFDPAANTLGVIDCDTLALAEPALDLANLAVHLDFRVAQGLLSPARSSRGRLAIFDTAASSGVRGERLTAYAAATALRLACIYAFRPPYRHLAVQWFGRVEEALDRGASYGTGYEWGFQRPEDFYGIDVQVSRSTGPKN